MNHPCSNNSINLTDELIDLLFDGEIDPRGLAERAGVSLVQLAQWAAAPQAGSLLRGLIRLADVRTQMLVCRYRASAAAQLIEMATCGEASELARKACVDLLRTELRSIEPSDAPQHDSPPAPSEEAILAALENLGRE